MVLVLTDKQLEREFYHSLSELSYEYIKSTKKSKLVPMTRPYWMLSSIHDDRPLKKVPPIPKSLLPVGNVVTLKERQNEIQEVKP